MKRDTIVIIFVSFFIVSPFRPDTTYFPKHSLPSFTPKQGSCPTSKTSEVKYDVMSGYTLLYCLMHLKTKIFLKNSRTLRECQ